jgi:hypothetical protein
MMTAADYVWNDLPLTYSPADILDYRDKVGAAILKGSIL